MHLLPNLRPAVNRSSSFQHNNTPVVKASTKELSYLIMIGNAAERCLILLFLSKFNSHCEPY